MSRSSSFQRRFTCAGDTVHRRYRSPRKLRCGVGDNDHSPSNSRRASWAARPAAACSVWGAIVLRKNTRTLRAVAASDLEVTRSRSMSLVNSDFPYSPLPRKPIRIPLAPFFAQHTIAKAIVVFAAHDPSLAETRLLLEAELLGQPHHPVVARLEKRGLRKEERVALPEKRGLSKEQRGGSARCSFLGIASLLIPHFSLLLPRAACGAL